MVKIEPHIMKISKVKIITAVDTPILEKNHLGTFEYQDLIKQEM